jgi:hypothetical protein
MSEFEHYTGCKRKDPLNCSACALTTGGEEGPNYAAWPLAYLINNRPIPKAWHGALKRELESSNVAYVQNLKAHLEKKGYVI